MGEPAAGLDAGLVGERHKLMTDLMVMAVACDQTRVFNMNYAAETASTTRPGYEKPHHTATHEEYIGPNGYQENVSWFTRRAMEQWAYFVEAFAEVKEGDGTLLDNCLIAYGSANSDGNAHNHDNLPLLLAGKGGGSIKQGRHVRFPKETPINNLWVALLQRMGVKIQSLGDSSGTLTV